MMFICPELIEEIGIPQAPFLARSDILACHGQARFWKNHAFV